MRTRIEELDTIRGYAIFGILVCNIFLFHHPLEYFSQFFFATKSTSNEVFNFIRFNYLGDRTYTVFSLLFGIGIGMQYQKFKEQNRSFIKQHVVRMLVLFLIGIIHTFLIWYGDILTLYSFLGICIIPLLSKSFKTLLITSFILFLIPTLYVVLARNGIFEISFGKTQVQSLTETINQNTNKGIIGHLRFNFSQIKSVYEYYASGMVFTSLGMIILGLSIGQATTFNQEIRNNKNHKKVLLICIPIILIWSLHQLFIFNPKEMGTTFNFYLFWVLSTTSTIAQTFFVFSGFFLLYSSKISNSIIVKGFNKIGKLSLSNYIFHSLFGLIAFKVFGFFGQSNPSLDFCLSIVVAIIQMFLSHWLIKKYGKGPLENMWRKLTLLLLKK